jgi:hypothetical protein
MYSNTQTTSTAAGALNRRRRLLRFVAVVSVVVALAVSSYGCGANLQLGKVLFGTDKPTADSKCAPSNPVTSVTATTAVYATYVFKSKPGSEQVSLEVTKAGASFIPKTSVPTTDTQGLDCFGDTTDLSTLPGWSAGTYHFVLTSNGSEVASGDLIVN